MNKSQNDPRRFVAFWSCWIVAASTFVAALIVLPMSTERIPIHWDIASAKRTVRHCRLRTVASAPNCGRTSRS